MKKRTTRGFTLMEVVLAIAAGLIILASVTVGYSYAKRSLIADGQRKDVAAIKTSVEEGIATEQSALSSGNGTGGLQPPLFAFTQMQQLASKLPSLQTDPYNGVNRSQGAAGGTYDCASGTSGSCIGAVQYGSGPITSPLNGGTTGSHVVYYYVTGNTTPFATSIPISLGDGTSRTFFGYAVIETDDVGNIVAADGNTDSTLGSSNG
jgi:prepilin-type N-terminal cleavage/methylation domain-containing protein